MTSKRPLSDPTESLAGGLSDSASASNQMKKVKVGASSGQDLPAMIITDPVHGDLRTAINIKQAIDDIDNLPRLGYCPTKVRAFFDQCGLGNESDSKKPNSEKQRDLSNQIILDELQTVYEDTESLSTSHACGETMYHFTLRITRPGCEYEGQVDSRIEALLPAWFEHSAIAGYGDMQALETKIDPDVRNAREIPASEYHVEESFLEKIQEKWGEFFLPREVCAKPYKIHLYGPGGHFKSHRDTPETGLVGTFLVGLGDTSSTPEGNFCIADEKLKADPRSWVAFHPDVPHEITKVEDGYRAVMAFKIFRVDDNEEEILPADLEVRIKKILDQIPAPFGLFTTHQYSMGTTSLSGFDALLSSYAHLRKGTQAHMLPVVTTFNGEAVYDHSDDGESYADSSVYPFTSAHVDILLERKNHAQAEQQVKWLDGLSDIPFYSWNLNESLQSWKEEQPDGRNYIGNEADSQREDSIYLAYAILFLPK